MQEKMKVSAVICELNPLHFGHKALFDCARSDSEALICILSGNFVQRGDIAIADKWARCAMALENGADLVIELPMPWALSGAERFAHGGTFLANAIGCVDKLYFGCEFPDLEMLCTIADALRSPLFTEALNNTPDTGLPFATRREQALASLLGPNVVPFLRSPNAILGIEYVKALQQTGSPIQPVPVQRMGNGHDTAARPSMFASSMELRKAILTGQDVSAQIPKSVETILNVQREAGQFPANVQLLERAILCQLRSLPLEAFASLPDVGEGLENRLIAAARQATSLQEFYRLVKTKRYTLARIRRLTWYAFLGIRRPVPDTPSYLRILGMNRTGEALLGQCAPAVPVITRAREVEKLSPEGKALFSLEAQADDLYGMALPVPVPCGREYTEKLIRR